jgi:hypothetical protein
LCSSEAQGITGQIFAVRGREVFLFSQPRPIERVVVPKEKPSMAALASLFEAEFQGKFTDLTTDLEAFNTDPIL